MNERQKFTIGQEVTWTSSAAGTTKKKVGRVVAVIPAGQRPHLRELFGNLYEQEYKVLVDPHSLSRKHETYIVAVPGKTKKAKLRLYWPVVSLLAGTERAASDAAPV